MRPARNPVSYTRITLDASNTVVALCACVIPKCRVNRPGPLTPVTPRINTQPGVPSGSAIKFKHSCMP